ncbi:MAG: hypothetical protein KDA71_14810, partial [Planctomycetales bacterium]|nr:hypothetical protein [Planctomycetales bacterium]
MEPTLAEIIVGQGNAARHPEIVLRLAPDLESLLGPTRRWLEDAIAGGARFLPGETVQLGWTLCKVNERADGRLSLLAPDMSSMPIEWTDDLSLAVQHLAVQYQAVKSIGVEPAFPNMRHSVLVGRDFDDTDVVIMHHQGSDGPADSGWFVGSESH